MKNIISRLVYLAQRLRLLFRISLLFLINAIRIRPLKVLSTFATDSLLIVDNNVAVSWRVSGCHRITLHRKNIATGQDLGIMLQLPLTETSIPLVFHGVYKQQTVIITLRAHRVSLTDKFEFHLKIPQIDSTHIDSRSSLGSIVPPIEVSHKRLTSDIPMAVLQIPKPNLS